MINGKITTIRPMEIEDIKFIHIWWNDGAAMEYSGLSFGFMLSLEALENRFRPLIEDQNLFNSNERMYIICKKSNMQPIGDISYRNWDKRNRSVEIGMEICDPSNRGKGYGKDAFTSFIDFIFRQLNVHRIELTTGENNKIAHSLYYKTGFKLIGTIRENYFNPRFNKYTDTLYMDLLREEWETKKNPDTFLI